MPLEAIAGWIEAFKKDNLYYMENLEQENGTDAYEILDNQKISSLLAVPICSQGNKEIIGFLGVDNPREHCNEPTLLSSMRYFIFNSLSIREEQNKLRYLSYCDILTGLYNRNKYMDDLDSYREKYLENIGVIYIDLNGLKVANDTLGHTAGDRLIRNASGAIKKIFPESGYRVGGDEFVVVCFQTEEEKFYAKVRELQEEMLLKSVSISMGMVWQKETENLEGMLKKADKRMYEEKGKYHRKAK